MLSIQESNVTILVTDLDQTIKFYESLGFRIKQKWEDSFAMMTARGITLEFKPVEKKKLSSGTVSIGLTVKEIDKAHELLEHYDISFDKDEKKSGIYLHFKDPDGTHLYFVEPRWNEK